jgi:hypothetical protein
VDGRRTAIGMGVRALSVAFIVTIGVSLLGVSPTSAASPPSPAPSLQALGPLPSVSSLPMCVNAIDRGNGPVPKAMPGLPGGPICNAGAISTSYPNGRGSAPSLAPPSGVAPAVSDGIQPSQFEGFIGNSVAPLTAVETEIQVPSFVSTPGGGSTASDWAMATPKIAGATNIGGIAQAGWLQWGGQGHGPGCTGLPANSVFAWAEFDPASGGQNDFCATQFTLSPGGFYMFLVIYAGNNTWWGMIWYNNAWMYLGGGGVNVGFSSSSANPEVNLEFRPFVQSQLEYNPSIARPNYTVNSAVYYSSGSYYWTPSSVNGTGQSLPEIPGYSLGLVQAYTYWFVT